jgi:lipopolysaccharide/colanic/teichoic acid biosynthesis glycosyltransferase
MLTEHPPQLRGAARPASRALKRALDLMLGSVLFAVTLPLLLAACAAVMFDSPGPAFYFQWRAGRDGRCFRIIKLRTMVRDADRVGPALTEDADPRITRAGSVLRRWSLDELPQLVNVLAGHMSLVGPRPELVPIVRAYTHRQRRVLRVRPGLTGWAQVNGRDDLPIPEKLELELEYVANRSTLRDLCILVRTAGVILHGRGVKHLTVPAPRTGRVTSGNAADAQRSARSHGRPRTGTASARAVQLEPRR